MVRRSKLKYFCCFVLLSLFVSEASAQFAYSVDSVKKVFPGAYLVASKIKTVFEFKVVNDEPKVFMDRYTEYFYVDEKALVSNMHSFMYSPTFESNIKREAIVYTPNEKGKLKSKEIKESKIANPVSTGVFYDDNKEVSYSYPDLKKGSYAVLSYSSILNEPRLLSPFYFHRRIPVLEASISVVVPENFKVRNVFYGDSSAFTKSIEEKKGKITYTWLGKYLQPIPDEEDAPNYSYYVPHLISLPVSYKKKNGEVVKILDKPSDLYKWYTGFVQNINQNEDEKINTLVDSIVKQNPDTLDRVKAIYKWVQLNLKYVAFEDGLGGFIPREAEKVFDRRYGDCKDMSSILYVMLRRAGIKAYYTWIGTRDLNYSYYEMPSPLCDNHMITAFRYHNQWYFLDGTTTYLAFGLPSGFIQGKEALIGISPDSFEIVKVPVVGSEINKAVDSMVVYLDEGVVKGTSKSVMSGYFKEDYMYSLSRHKNVEDPANMSGLLEMGNNKFQLKSVGVKGMEDNNKDLIFDYEFEIPNYSKQVDKNIYVNLNFDKQLSNEYLKREKRKTDRQFGYQYSASQHIVLQLPEGCKLVKLPEGVNCHNELLDYTIRYSVNDRMIIMDKQINLNTLLIENKDFENWDELIGKISNASREVITLETTK